MNCCFRPAGVQSVPSWTGRGAQLGHFRSGWVALPDHPCTTCQGPPQGSLRGPSRQALFPKWWFYVHGSVPFGVSGRFAYTGAPVLQAAGLSIFQRHKSDEHFTCTGSYFFLAARLAFGWGCPAGLGKGRLQGHPSRGQSAGSSVSRKREHTFCRKRAFRVHGNTGSAGQPGPRARQLAKFRAPVQLAGCLLGAGSTSLVSQVGVLRRRERTFGRKLVFRVHGSTISAGRRPSISKGRKIDERFTCTGGDLFLAARLAFGSGCPAGLGKGRLQGHPGRGQSVESSVSRKREDAFYRKRAFRVHGSTGSAE